MQLRNRYNPYLLPFILVTSLFFMWGFAISMLDVLNKHFQEALKVTKAQSGLIQFVVYGAYFLMALPAGYFMRTYSYKKGILIGLSLYAAGAFLFYPAIQQATFEFFLLALFIIGCGLAILETAANPYITVLGDPKEATQRLNLAQSFNGLGVVLGPLIGGLVLFSDQHEETVSLETIKMPYLIIGMLVLFLLVVFYFIDLPDVQAEDTSKSDADTNQMKGDRQLFAHKHFVYGIIALFFYVGAQAGVWAFFINYAVEEVPYITNQQGAFYLTAAMIAYTLGRFGGTLMMRYVSPQLLLFLYAIIAILAMVIVVSQLGMISVYAMILGCFCMSIMFPTIFSLGIRKLGRQTKQAGSYMITSIVGGAVVPPFMGLIADTRGISLSFLVPIGCFIVVLWYAAVGYKKRLS